MQVVIAEDVVRLRGGPMDGWLVTPDAPALDSGWGATSGHPGWRYELVGTDDVGTPEARWTRQEGA